MCDFPDGVIRLAYDPSGDADSVDGVGFLLYGNQRIRTTADVSSYSFGGSATCGSTVNPDPSDEADWFSW